MKIPSLLHSQLLYLDGMIRKQRDDDRVAMASFPRSGNTWLRNLIEKATAEQTGTIYSWEIQGQRKPHGIAIKTHLNDSRNYHRAIHLVRNPFDAIESFFHYRRTIIGDASLTWPRHVRFAGRWWAAHARHWLNARCPTHRLRYESLRHDPVTEMAELLTWLGRPTDRPTIEAAVEACRIDKLRKRDRARVGERADHFYRRGKVGLGIEAFTDEQIDWLLGKTGPYLERLGYEPGMLTQPAASPA